MSAPALFVSDNGGLSWEERDRSQGMVWRPFYFGRIVVDPKNPDRLFKMGYSITVSDDGGKSFSNAAGGSHGDWHDIWINPPTPKTSSAATMAASGQLRRRRTGWKG